MNPFQQSLNTGRTTFEQQQGNFLRYRRPIRIVRVQTTATTIIATGDEDVNIERLVAANVAAGTATLTLHLFATGGAAGAANMIASALSLAVNTTTELTWAAGLTIEPNYTLAALTGTNNDVHVFGSAFLVEGGPQ